MTKDAFDAYLFKDGKPLALTSENKSDVGEVDADGNYSIAKLLEVRDARLAKTIDPFVYYDSAPKASCLLDDWWLYSGQN